MKNPTLFAPQIMGILNITPDSFLDQGKYSSLEKAAKRATEIYEEGASLIDIGGESTRPGSNSITPQEELQRVKPILKYLYSQNYPLPISIDTRNATTAQAALDLGARLINDISGGIDPQMRKLVKRYGVEICIMHMRGEPKTMQVDPNYPEGIIPHLINWFETRIEWLMQDEVDLSQIILDPGIGFGKTVSHNMEIYRSLAQIKSHFGLRIMIGGSHKSFMRGICKKQNLLPATLVMHTIASIQKIDILRVHNVCEHSDLAKLVSSYLS